MGRGLSGVGRRVPRGIAGLPAWLGRRAARIRVRDAWLAPERYAGRRVVAEGVVRAFEAGTPREYYRIDDGPHRIDLRGDGARLRALVGRPVRATGTLSFRPGVGIFLDAEVVRALAPDRPRRAWHA